MRNVKKLISLLTVAVMFVSAFGTFAFAEETESTECDHVWTDWELYTEATCGEQGEEVRYCIYCGQSEERQIDPTEDHEWADWEVVKKATIKKKGKKEAVCIECGTVKTAVIKKLKPFVKFAKKTYTIKKGKSLNLKKKVKYANGDKIKKWKSSNRKVAIVNSKGKVTARKAGTAKITVTMKSGKKATCKIKVKAAKKKAKKKAVGTVYWTPSGKVYHSTKSCPTLSRSRTIHSGPLSKCPKSRACYVCF